MSRTQPARLPIVNLADYSAESKLNTEFVQRLIEEKERLRKLTEFQAREIKRLRRQIRER